LAEVRSNLGTLLFGAGDYAAAVDCFETALRDRPELAEVHRKLAAALLKTGQANKAAEQCRAALQLAPDDVESFAILAQADVQMGHLAEAILDAETAITLARLQGRTALAQELETSLNAFRAQLTNPPAEKSHEPPP
jgi:tetratricopeptide (TPR) repeat protein